MMNKFMCLLILVRYACTTTRPKDAERAKIVVIFTKIREEVKPNASNMNMLAYSDDMENVAAKWVSRCSFWYPHPSSFPEINGSNMLLQESASLNNIFQSAGFYANQANNYDYDNNTCNGNCRYYKLMVWATSTEIGCAYNECPAQYNDKRAYLLSCVFTNVSSEHDLKERPYIAGESCSNCTPGLVCRRKQCAKPELTTISISTTTTQYQSTTSPNGTPHLNTTTIAVSSTPQYQTTTSPQRTQQINSTPGTTSSTTVTTVQISTTTSDASRILHPALLHLAMPLIARLVQSS
uniref:SCP domain-containing protein n=2 Tax=Mesocestoides corti TaxID=53468 RepID=A0A5K3FLA0_MESCO